MFKFIAVHKVVGESSFGSLGKVKKYFQTKKIGHLGTLDVLAEGVLAVAIGEATKVIPYINTEPKEYVVEIFFGYETAGLDAEGVDKAKVFDVGEKVNFLSSELLANLQILKEQEWQYPPKFSAIKIEGRRAYDLARKGELDESKIKAKRVTLFDYELLSFDLPLVKLRLKTSSGYYVRSLVRDLAELLGVKAFMFSLIRTKVGPFVLENCSNFAEDDIREYFLADLVEDFCRLDLSEKDYKAVKNGLPLLGVNFALHGKNLVFGYFENRLVSLLKIDTVKDEIRPVKNFNL